MGGSGNRQQQNESRFKQSTEKVREEGYLIHGSEYDIEYRSRVSQELRQMEANQEQILKAAKREAIGYERDRSVQSEGTGLTRDMPANTGTANEDWHLEPTGPTRQQDMSLQAAQASAFRVRNQNSILLWHGSLETGDTPKSKFPVQVLAAAYFRRRKMHFAPLSPYIFPSQGRG